MGRRPKPTSLKLITGNPGKRALPEEEIVPPEGEIVMPKFLTYREVELWDEYLPKCKAMGTVTAADPLTLANWCVLQAEYEKKKADMKGTLITQLRCYAGSLGLDAPSRAKAGYMKPRPKDPSRKYFGKKNAS